MRTNDGFIKYGSSHSNLIYTLPFPTMGKALFQTERLVDAARNANGVVVGQQVGRSLDKQNMGWTRIEPEKWWEFNNFLESHGMFFSVEFFNYNLGVLQRKRFYASNPQCEPVNVNRITLKPEYLENAQVNIIDTGE